MGSGTALAMRAGEHCSCAELCSAELTEGSENHRIAWGWTFEGRLVQTPCTGRDIFNSIRLFTAPSNLTLNISRDGASTISLGNLIVKNFFFISSLNLPSAFPHSRGAPAFGSPLWPCIPPAECNFQLLFFFFAEILQHDPPGETLMRDFQPAALLLTKKQPS